MKLLLEEFNLIRYAINFDTETLATSRVEKNQLPADAFSWGNPNSPIKGCFADIGEERVYLYSLPSDKKTIFGSNNQRIFQTSDGKKILINERLKAEFGPRVDLPHKEGERWMEFRLTDDFANQVVYIAIYDVAPILKMYWQDFTPHIEYKDWDFNAYLKDRIDQYREAAARVAQGLNPDPYSDPNYVAPAVPELPFREVLRGLPNEEVFKTGYWWSPAFQGEDRVQHFKQGERFPATAMTNYGQVIWYYDSERQSPST